MTYRNGTSPWDLNIGGVRVKDLDGMLAWLQVAQDRHQDQVASVKVFLVMNAQEVPADLFVALVDFVEGPSR